jgi:hypothetical protein
MKHRLKDVSRHLTFADQSFKIGEFLFKPTQVSTAFPSHSSASGGLQKQISTHLIRPSS